MASEITDLEEIVTAGAATTRKRMTPLIFEALDGIGEPGPRYAAFAIGKRTSPAGILLALPPDAISDEILDAVVGTEEEGTLSKQFMRDREVFGVEHPTVMKKSKGAPLIPVLVVELEFPGGEDYPYRLSYFSSVPAGEDYMPFFLAEDSYPLWPFYQSLITLGKEYAELGDTARASGYSTAFEEAPERAPTRKAARTTPPLLRCTLVWMRWLYNL